MKKDLLPILIILEILIILVVIWYYFPDYINHQLNVGTEQQIKQSDRWTRNGTFGDTYGALNALFSVKGEKQLENDRKTHITNNFVIQ